MSTTTDATPIQGVVAEPPAEAPAETGPVPFDELPLREQHAVMGRYAAFKSAVLDYEKELKQVYGSALFDAYQQHGFPSFRHEFGDGLEVTFTVKRAEDKFEVTDDQALTEFVEEHYPSEVETVTTVRESFAKVLVSPKRLTAETDDDGDVHVIDTVTGLEVPGVKFTKGGYARENGYQTSWKGGNAAKQAAINEVLGSTVDAVIPALTAGGEQ